MNNRQNGRRRGRGGQQARNGQPGSPDRGNRLDNRARGNAAQLLEKYKNLARDSQMQGDRVNTEYFLQFADHYFRILNENRARFEEQRPRHGEYRDEFGGEDDSGEGDQQQRFHGREGQGSDDGWDDGDQPPAPEQRDQREPRRERQAYQNEGESERGASRESERTGAREGDRTAAREGDRSGSREGERSANREGERTGNREGGRERGRRNGNTANPNSVANGNGFTAPDFLSEPISPRYDLSADDEAEEQARAPEAGPAQEEAAPKRRRAPRRPRGETTVEA